MLAIQDQTQRINTDSDVDESFENDESVLEEGDTLQSEPFHSPHQNNPSSNINNNSQDCNNCHKIEKELSNHMKQIEHLLKREKDLEEKLIEENTVFLNKNMDMQDIIHEKDSLLKDQILQIESHKEKESELQFKVEDFELMSEKVSCLQDEVDLLQPLQKRSESAENQLSRMHEKLDKLDGVKDQLKAEVESHNETQTELLELQVEIDSLRKAKVQVVEYRDRCAENAITIGDLTCQLKSSKEEIQDLTIKLNQVSEGHHITENYSKSLVDELKVASEALRNSEREGGIGKNRCIEYIACHTTSDELCIVPTILNKLVSYLYMVLLNEPLTLLSITSGRWRHQRIESRNIQRVKSPSSGECRTVE